MKLYVAVLVGGIGVLVLLAGVNSSAKGLLGSLFGKGVKGDVPTDPKPISGVNSMFGTGGPTGGPNAGGRGTAHAQ